MYIENNNKKIIVNECVGFWNRFRGFMMRSETIKEGLRFSKCKSIHTYFMLQSIDVIMTDRDNKIIKLYKSLYSERFILPKKKVYYTYELPVGSIGSLKVGDILKIVEK